MVANIAPAPNSYTESNIHMIINALKDGHKLDDSGVE